MYSMYFLGEESLGRGLEKGCGGTRRRGLRNIYFQAEMEWFKRRFWGEQKGCAVFIWLQLWRFAFTAVAWDNTCISMTWRQRKGSHGLPPWEENMEIWPFVNDENLWITCMLLAQKVLSLGFKMYLFLDLSWPCEDSVLNKVQIWNISEETNRGKDTTTLRIY